MALPNVWHLRKVAEASSKPCEICYKPTTSVLITPDSKVRRLWKPLEPQLICQDFFYACLGHTKDRGFCSPIIDEAEAAARKKKEDLDREIEAIKQEYEEKLKRKKKNKDSKEKGKEKDKEKSGTKDSEDDDAKAEKEKDDKVRAHCEDRQFFPRLHEELRSRRSLTRLQQPRQQTTYLGYIRYKSKNPPLVTGFDTNL